MHAPPALARLAGFTLDRRHKRPRGENAAEGASPFREDIVAKSTSRSSAAKSSDKKPAAAKAASPKSASAAKPARSAKPAEEAPATPPVSALGRTVTEVPADAVRAGAKRKGTSGKADASAKPARTAKASTTKPSAAKTETMSASAGANTKPGTAKAAKTSSSKATTAKASATGTSTKASASKASAARPDTAKGEGTEASASARRSTRAGSAKASSGKTGSGAKTRATASKEGSAVASKPWLKSYPEGIASEIAPLAFQSIGDMLVDACRKYGGRPAFTCMDKTITFAELERQSAAFGAFLQSKGLARGSRVAIMMPNILQYPVALIGILRAGYTVVNVNPLYTPRELEHQLNDSGASAIIILENFANTLQKIVGKTKVKHVVVAAMGDMMGLKGHIVNFVVRRVKKMVPAWDLPGHIPFKAALAAGKSATLKPAQVTADDVAFLQYTGGTTGVSKGATLLHRNVLANVAQNEIWMQAAYAGKPKPERLVFICALPLYHIYALTVNALMGMQQGGQNILIPNPRDIPAFVAELKKYKFHIFPGLNTLFNALLNNEDFRKLDFSQLLLTFGGGMAVQSAVADRWKKLTGITVAEGYGLSETSPVATANRFDGGEFTGTIGLPIPSTEIAILDDDGKELPLGEVGEIAIRGPQVMAGYWNRPDETAQVMTPDGFFKSGDMGFMDERGYVKIVDRKKDMILVSGFNVYPTEIEDVVARHPGVMEAAAIGVPDEKSGEAPKLFVVKKDPSLTEDDIRKFCAENLTAYKRPKTVEFRSELPKSNVGKILRKDLRE
ncbi:MAG: long-chain-fatty-acid--CoA ligase [Rhizobiaceae bacterium]|nr:long-chain-fatty-acid--CoA ligase [Rhizobiaceae bacterium]MCV0405817.1 long-chain-fatty-acid--CoA ligase [Rhizobiaceae bacterium]